MKDGAQGDDTRGQGANAPAEMQPDAQEGAPVAPVAAFDGARLGGLVFDELVKLQAALVRGTIEPLLRLQIRAAGPGAAGEPRAADAESSDSTEREVVEEHEKEMVELLQSAERFVLQQPVAAQRIFSGLVAEGRRYARTREGGQWLELLDASREVAIARRIWSGSLLNVLEEDPECVLPSAVIEVLYGLARESDADCEGILSAARREDIR